MFKGGLGDLLQQAGRLKDEVQRAQDSAARKTVEGTAGGGMVKVTANGKGQIVSVQLDPEMMKLNDREMLQDLITAGVNQALKASQDLMSQEMGPIMGGLGPLMSLLRGI